MAHYERLDQALVEESAKDASERDAAEAARVRTELGETQKRLAALDARLDKEFPTYRELTDPKPVPLESAQKLLAEDEALVVYLSEADALYAFVVRRGRADFFRTAVKRTDLASEVKRLRALVDPTNNEPSELIAKPYDAALAYTLYKQVLAPLEPQLVGVKNLIVVPDGPLQSLPLGILLTAQPAKPRATLADMRSLPWLAAQYTTTTLPAVSSLRALRAFARPTLAAEAFVGFGNPVLVGDKQESRGGGQTVAKLMSRGTAADVNDVRKRSPLPDTADELRAVAKTLGASEKSLMMGDAATETQLKSMDLTRYRRVSLRSGEHNPKSKG